MSASAIGSAPPPSTQVYSAPQPTAADQVNEAIDQGVDWAAEKVGDGIEWLGDRIGEGIDWMNDKSNRDLRQQFGDCLDGISEKKLGTAINECWDAVHDAINGSDGEQTQTPDDVLYI
jgi:hypothetical protein